jgi:hypothetical protein
MGRDGRNAKQTKKPTRLSAMATEGVFGEPLESGAWARVPSIVWERLSILLDGGCYIGLGKTSDGGCLTVYIKDGDDVAKVRGTCYQMDGLLEPYSLLYDDGQP